MSNLNSINSNSILAIGYDNKGHPYYIKLSYL